MANVLALPDLYDAVVARFAAESTLVPNLFGWRDPPQKLTLGTRICWVPGDDASGDVGDVGAARYPGRNPRPLGTLNEIFTVLILSSDTATPEFERAQYQAVRELFDAWYRACYLHARDTFAVRSSSWVIEKRERRYGACLRLVCTIQAMIPDAPATDANADVGMNAGVVAALDTTELDVTETDTAQGDNA